MFAKKFLVSLFSILIVPVFCYLTSLFLNDCNYTNLFMSILYFLLSIGCVFFFWGKKVKHGDLLLALVIGFITATYTIPLSYIGIAASLCTVCVFLVCRDVLAKLDSSFVWIRAEIKSNIAILGSISLLYSILFFAQHNDSFSFSALSALKAWAPAISEELIFRVFLPLMVFKLLKLEDSVGNKVWVFFIITIPFALLHCTDSLMANDISRVISRCYTSILNSFIHAVLISRYGFFYGVYAHALSDFIAMTSMS